ncbi:DUF1993 domain-containing protein [Duganella callida]|uniref:DUF1993 domain-containing protein n=1 Tax=Duganella callida TaxID=2561932 RepID=A0A4Y9SFF0_9BURK|nr:DUF1993 domain-containing protein [Duganella callida]TFW18691.1 DUF1993 domain-containing protein [Duganella callida]
MHTQIIPPLLKAIDIMTLYLDKGLAHVAHAGVSEDTLLQARLAPDMLTLAGQVQRLSDNSRYGAARLANKSAPAMADEEKSFAELKIRLADTTSYLQSLPPPQFEQAESREITLSFRSIARTVSGHEYFNGILLPNVYFHLSIAHGILRSRGLAIGKRDFLGETLLENYR